MAVVRLDVTASRELLATILTMRACDRTIAKMVRKETRAVAEPAWRQALAERADSRLSQRVLVNTAVVSVSNQNVRVKSAMKGRPLSGGLNPKTDWHAIEFGADTGKTTTYDSFRGHTRFPVTRHTARQLQPRRRSGYVFYPAANEMIPRLAALWVQTVVRTIATALGGETE